MDEARAVAFGELRGLLEAFARVNDRANHCYTFTLEHVAAGASTSDAIQKHLARGGITTSPVADWKGGLRSALNKWLFEFVRAVQKRLVHDGKVYNFVYPGEDFNFGDESLREDFIAGLVSRLEVALRPTAMLVVRLEHPAGVYDCDWSDHAFESAEGLFLLHLGVSD